MDKTSQDLEVYTIPSYSSWFAWNNIHEVERFSLREFFDGSTVTRSPRIYKEYRDFIISKYREDPSRKLTFTEVRKSLVGDVSILLKVFTFLEKWGLINFNAADNNNEKTERDEEDEKWKGRVKEEEGAPHGVRVVAAPNTVKPVLPPPQPPSVAVDGGGFVGELGENGFKWPPLASYSDIYGELIGPQKEGLVCGSCKDDCDSAHYEYAKETNYVLCQKCFKGVNYDQDKVADDFKLKDCVNQATVWTEAETSLLLESVLKHGDDWDLVAKNVQTKTKLECISKLIQLPFGDLMLGAVHRKGRYLDLLADNSDSKPANICSDKPQRDVKEEPNSELHDKNQPDGDAENEEGPPSKKVRSEFTSDVGISLMKEIRNDSLFPLVCGKTLRKRLVVARISRLLGPHVTASANEAAVASLCFENQCSREIFDDDDNNMNMKSSPEISNQQSLADGDDVAEDERPIQSEIQETSSANNIIPLNLRMRAASATALGAAAANAKLLADQEEREIAHLVATMIESQLKKLRRKMKYFEEMELIMEKEYRQLEKLEESLLAQRMSFMQTVVDVAKSKEHDNDITNCSMDVVQ
ncbi:SWI/SNF complex subunit SMARCC2 [Striga asiatica]|uniref:SWI/SNF complex subunit SMARCC2 n=1 Tax=Striga asiatica TaxID=4170 RepID=A0A5A7PNP7_STRAF|nr:SWI/SNF complex subunit SMARCC2 [Striga asiatica]